MEQEPADTVWWCQKDGFELLPAPGPLRDADQAAEAGQAWDTALGAAGFDQRDPFGCRNTGGIEVGWWRHRDGGVLLDWDDGVFGQVIRVWLPDDAEAAAFMFTHLAGWSVLAAVEDLAAIRRTLAAFVRHGHGTRTIDETGEVTFEALQAREDAARRRRAAAR
jgi:hypothetical protein